MSSDTSSNQVPKPPTNSPSAASSSPPQTLATAKKPAQSSSILSGIGARSGLIAALSSTISKIRSPITKVPYASADVTREVSAPRRDNSAEDGKPSTTDQRDVASTIQPSSFACSVEAMGSKESPPESVPATQNSLGSTPSNDSDGSISKNLVTEMKASKKASGVISPTHKTAAFSEIATPLSPLASEKQVTSVGDDTKTTDEVAKEILIKPLVPNKPKSKTSHDSDKQPGKNTSLEKATTDSVVATATSSSTSQYVETEGADKSNPTKQPVSESAELARPTVATTNTSTTLAAPATLQPEENHNSSKDVADNAKDTKDDGNNEINQNQKSHRDLASAKWLENYKLLQEFKRKHGHCRVPRRYAENSHFGTWVANQRAQYRTYVQMLDGRKNEKNKHIDNNVRYNFMYDERYQLLQKLGFEIKCKRGGKKSGNAGGGEGASGGNDEKNDTADVDADGKGLKKKGNSDSNADVSKDCKSNAKKATLKSKPLSTSTLPKNESPPIKNSNNQRNESQTAETAINSELHERRNRLRRERFEFLEAVGLKHIADKWGKKKYGFDPSYYDDGEVPSSPSSLLLSEDNNKRKLSSLNPPAADSPRDDCKKPKLYPEGNSCDNTDSQEHTALRTIRVYRIHNIVPSDKPGDPPHLSFTTSVHRL